MYRNLTQLTALLMVALGIAMLVVTFAHGGGTAGVVLGLLFVAAGGGRFYLLRRRA